MGAVGNRRGSDECSARSRARESSEDYLEAILIIRAERGFCRNVDITERLGVSRPSVTKALANLSPQPLVEVVDHDVRLPQRAAVGILDQGKVTRRTACAAQNNGSWRSGPVSSST